jgi:2-polyprenyl-3-methyl-5-hydroxy-6-metoxy-1,4-benzoquinol methylase
MSRFKSVSGPMENKMQHSASGVSASHAEQDLQENEYSFPYHYVTEFHDNWFRQHFVDTWGINYALTLEFMIERLNKIAPSSVIDIGCGDGRLTRELDIHATADRVVGVDYSKRAVQLARAMNQDRPDLEFFALDITAPHALESFDAAVLMEVFEHIPIDQAANFMQSVRGLLKPGAKLMITVPHSNKPLEYKHFQHFTSESLVRYLEPHFRVDEIIPFEKKSWSRRILDKLLCNQWFVLNNLRLLRVIYRSHKSQLFYCKSESDCQRLFIQATAV